MFMCRATPREYLKSLCKVHKAGMRIGISSNIAIIVVSIGIILKLFFHFLIFSKFNADSSQLAAEFGILVVSA